MIDLLNPDGFLWRSVIVGLLVVVVAAPLGCFIVWRRLAYFSDSLAHSSLLGVGIALIFGISVNFGLIAIGLCFAFLLHYLSAKGDIATDTLLGILAHGALAGGLLLSAILGNNQLDINAFLFGDILAVGRNEFWAVLANSIIALLLLYVFWKPFVLATLHEDLARADGNAVAQLKLLFTLMLTLTVASSIRVVGILLLTALLITPAATARHLSSSPAQMALIAVLFGVLSVLGGIALSFYWDLPTGPSIVANSILWFTLVTGYSSLK